jgi:hypothetical protein
LKKVIKTSINTKPLLINMALIDDQSVKNTPKRAGRKPLQETPELKVSLKINKK